MEEHPPQPQPSWPAVGQPDPASSAASSGAGTVVLPPIQHGFLGSLLRVLARRTLYTGLLLGRLIRPRLGWVVLTTALLAVIAAEALMLVAPLLGRDSQSDSRTALLQPSPAIERFLEGQARYDADMMWEAFSPLLKESLSERGIAKESLAAQAESERKAGQRYRSFAYVGGVRLPNNHSRYFYVVDIEAPSPAPSGRFSFIFTADSDGKILSVKMDS